CSLLPGALAAGGHPFTDVPADHWANDAVTYVYENELMGGTGGKTFSPNTETTRGMVVTILYRLAGEPAV
ncbi:S-layer homology domain-containing protein, partial [Acinetobacter sp. 163]|nr:S-layer homology domain-containing protein [Acinetobacter sp. 163]